jgi:membrane associated rhomboid family serine protease
MLSGEVPGGVIRDPQISSALNRQSRPKRSESSFAFWQLTRKHSQEGLHWNGDQKTPYFCYLVIIVTGIILFSEIAVNGFQIENFADNATLGPSKATLIAMGAKRADLIIHGGFHRLIGAWWLHGGILHWLINMVALRNLGFSMEREFGTPKIAIIYCWSGIAGVLSSSVFIPNLVGVGASGAIFGIFGASWADFIQNYGLYKTRKEERRTLRNLTIGTLINFLLGLVPIM